METYLQMQTMHVSSFAQPDQATNKQLNVVSWAFAVILSSDKISFCSNVMLPLTAGVPEWVWSKAYRAR
jgi:hypothetical protein